MPISQKTVLELLTTTRTLADQVEQLARQSHRWVSEMSPATYKRYVHAQLASLHEEAQAALMHAKLIALRDEVPADKVNLPWEDEAKKPE